MFPGYGWCRGPFFFEADIRPDAKLAGRTADDTPLRIFEDEAMRRVFAFPCGGAWGEVHTIAGAYAVLDEVGRGVSRGGADNLSTAGATGDVAVAEGAGWLCEVMSYTNKISTS
jgi:hypothetical protein